MMTDKIVTEKKYRTYLFMAVSKLLRILCRHATACIKDKRLAVLEYKRAFFILKTY